MSLWWIAWAAGGLLLVPFAIAVTRAYGDRPAPQLAFGRTPPGPIRWWGWLSLGAAVVLIPLASDRLTSTETGWFALVAAAYACGAIGQSLVVWRHNRSRRSSTAPR